MCHVAEVERATSYVARRVEAQVTLWFGSTATEGYWVGVVVGPQFTGLGSKCLGCWPVQLDHEFGLGLVQLNRGFWARLRFGPL